MTGSQRREGQRSTNAVRGEELRRAGAGTRPPRTPFTSDALDVVLLVVDSSTSIGRRSLRYVMSAGGDGTRGASDALDVVLLVVDSK